MTGKINLQVCVTCLDSDGKKVGAEFYAALEEWVDREKINLQPVECFAVCKRPCTVTVSQAGKWLYMIGDLQVDRDIPALFEYTRVYDNSPNGRPPISERPDIVKNGTISRLPPEIKT